MKKTAKILYAYAVINNDDLSVSFKRIGTAFVNRDQSINLMLDKIPVGGRVHLSQTLREVQPCAT